MADLKLVLHPQDPQAILQDPPEFKEALRQVGLLGHDRRRRDRGRACRDGDCFRIDRLATGRVVSDTG